MGDFFYEVLTDLSILKSASGYEEGCTRGAFPILPLRELKMPSESTFESKDPFLHSLLNEIHEGTLQLPDFQRGWVWDDDHIRSLIASVTQSYPIGAVMLLESGGNSFNYGDYSRFCTKSVM